MLPAGIEPASPPSEGDILSIERRERRLDYSTRLEIKRNAVTKTAFRYLVLPAGIEPTLHPPQGCVLSVERRERATTVPFLARLRNLETQHRRDALDNTLLVHAFGEML